MRRIVVALATAVALAAVTTGAGAMTGAGAATSSGAMVRVDQVGYAADAAKTAYLMLPTRVSEVPFAVVDGRGAVAYRGVSRDDAGGWNNQYRAVYALNFSALRRHGTYRVEAGGAVSPAFEIASGDDLYQRLLANAVRYFTSERDGANVVPSVLGRQPANLTDARAQVYASPLYDANDNLVGTFHKIGGPVDVSGGWFDAGGGYEKFGYTGSYTDALLLIASRSQPRDAVLRSEAAFGLNWMTKLWDPAKRVMYMQVGIGNGNASGTIQGDYDYWFLPQAEDRLGARPGAPDYYVEYRPVFEAAAPGQPVSPDLAGRYAADYALGAQLAGRGMGGESGGNVSGGEGGLLALARSVLADAQTTHVGSIVTTYPHDYYPGTEWSSDMLWGAAEIALADETLHVGRARLDADLAVAQRWARAYVAQLHSDTFNLYDTGAIAEGELLRALAGAGDRHGTLAGLLVGDLGSQLRLGESSAAGDPFALGTGLGSSDATPHAFGLYVTEALYTEYGGSAAYAPFAQRQLDFALGANGWGSSFVVGAGTVYPHCMQSEIANLAGSLSGHGNIQLGAVTDGPNAPGNFIGLGTVTGMRACSSGSYAAFDTPAAAYEDNVVSWPSVEPAADYTAVSLLAFALGAADE